MPRCLNVSHPLIVNMKVFVNVVKRNLIADNLFTLWHLEQFNGILEMIVVK